MSRNAWLLIPLLGIGLYVVFFIAAATVYPGGSNDDRTARGFSILHNYWCDLLGSQAKNGETSHSRPIAVTATLFLTFGLGLLWFFLPRLFETRNRYQTVIQFSGICSMMCIWLLFTSYHETAIVTAGATGLLALAFTFRELYREKQRMLFRWGMVCLALMIINNFIYYTGTFLWLLPVIQKITLLVVLSWFASITLCIYRKERRSNDLR